MVTPGVLDIAKINDFCLVVYSEFSDPCRMIQDTISLIKCFYPLPMLQR